jgi:hypothetical protein
VNSIRNAVPLLRRQGNLDLSKDTWLPPKEARKYLLIEFNLDIDRATLEYIGKKYNYLSEKGYLIIDLHRIIEECFSPDIPEGYIALSVACEKLNINYTVGRQWAKEKKVASVLLRIGAKGVLFVYEEEFREYSLSRIHNKYGKGRKINRKPIYGKYGHRMDSDRSNRRRLGSGGWKRAGL